MRFSKIFRFTLGSRILAVKINAWNQELHTHKGITNQVPGTQLYIPFWDFEENKSLERIRDGLRRIQEEQYLGDIYIIQTTPQLSFRAFSFDEMGWQYYISILAGTENIDLNFLKFTVMRNRAVIRITEKDGTKNKLVDIIRAKEPSDNSLFGAIHHKAFLHLIYPEVPNPKFIPNPIKLKGSKYESFR